MSLSTKLLSKLLIRAAVNAYRKLKLSITISEYSTTQRSLCGKEKRYSTQHTIPQNLNLKNILTKPSHLLLLTVSNNILKSAATFRIYCFLHMSALLLFVIYYLLFIVYHLHSYCSSSCFPVIENITHSDMFVAWSPILSIYLAAIRRLAACSPSFTFSWIIFISSFFTLSNKSSTS